jgi:hypothetical protein
MILDHTQTLSDSPAISNRQKCGIYEDWLTNGLDGSTSVQEYYLNSTLWRASAQFGAVNLYKKQLNNNVQLYIYVRVLIWAGA